MTRKTWLITGCSSGLGRAIAEAALASGDRAVITARDATSLVDLVDRYGDDALAIALDVTDPLRITSVVEAAVGRFGTIDVLVNNAGYGYRSAVEEGEDHDIRAMFDVNVFGLAAMTRAVLPVMRARRSGVIVTMSSIGGRSAPPGSGYYAASKFAVEGLSDALRKEVHPLGIRVLVVEPGPFRTDFAGRSLVQTPVEIGDYANTAGPRRKENDRIDGRQQGDPVKAAAAILAAVDRPNPFRLLLGRSALDRARETLEEQRSELDEWAGIALGADFGYSIDDSSAI